MNYHVSSTYHSHLTSKRIRGKIVQTYLVVILKRGGIFSAHLPDVRGCIAFSSELEGVKKDIAKCMNWHIKCIIEDEDEFPAPVTKTFLGTIGESECLVEEGIIRIEVGLQATNLD